MCSSDPQIKLGEEADKIMRAFTANYPAMAQTMQAQAVPFAQSDLAASEATYPKMQQLGINTDLANVQGSGGKLASAATDLDKATNPEYYKTRSESSNALGDLFKSIDLSGALGGGERAEIERSNNRSNIASGATNQAPLTAVENAMNFGQAGVQKKLAEQGLMQGAIGAANGAMPAMRSPVDTFQIATGRSSMPSSSGGLSAATQTGSGVSGSLSGLAGSAMDANVSRRSGFEKFMGAMPSYSG